MEMERTLILRRLTGELSAKTRYMLLVGGVALHNKVISGKIGLFLVRLKGYLLSHRVQGEGNPSPSAKKRKFSEES